MDYAIASTTVSPWPARTTTLQGSMAEEAAARLRAALVSIA